MTGASQMDDARWEHMEENLNLLFSQITDMGTTQQHPRQQQRAAADQVRHAQHLSMASVVSEMGDSEVFDELTHWDDDEMFDDRSLSEVIWDREASNELFDARSAQAVIWDEESLSERVAYSVFEEMPLKDNVAALLEQAMFSTTMEAKDGSKMVFAEVLLENDATTLVEQITFVAPIASKGATHEVIWDEEPQQFGGEMGAAGNGSNTKFLSLQVGERDDRSGNTKLYSDFTAAKMQVNPFNDDSSLIHIKLEQSLSSVQAFVAEHMNSKDLDMDWSKEAVGLNGFRDVGCNDLRDVAVNSLRMFFKTAVQMLSSEGYTEDDVVNAIVDSALCYQFDGPINKITEHARTLLQSGHHQVDYSHSENAETVLHMLGLYFVCNASSLLKQCCPFFTLGDALWCILLCELDISIAREAFAYMSGYGNGQSEGHALRQRDLCEDRENASDLSEEYGCSSATESPAHFEPPQSALERMWSSILADYIVSVQNSATKNQNAPAAQDESSSIPKAAVQNKKKTKKGNCGRINSMKSQKDTGKDVVVFKNVPQVKGIMSKTSSRMLKESRSLMAFLGSAQSTLAGISEVANKKSLQPCTLVPTQPLSGPSSVKRRDSAAMVSTGPLSSPVGCSSNSPSTAKAESKQQMLPDVVQFSLPNTPAEDFEFSFSRDGMKTSWVPKDRKEELALKLVQRLGELKLEVKLWTYWANERVMQSTSRLVNERAVLLSLKKDKADVEEPDVFNRKKVEETQKALDSTSEELDRVNSHVQELTDKMSKCRREKKAVLLQGKQADERLTSISSKENESMDRLKSMETEKILLQEELVAERDKLSKLLKSVEQSRKSEDILKKRCQEGEKMLDALTKQVNFERSELERIDTSARAKASNVLLKAQNNQEWLQASIRSLKQQVDEMSSFSKLQRVAKFMGPPGFGVDSLQREQECVMCLEEEISVVFLPCGHQVVCAGCNQRHRDVGMAECPSCRSPIERRICARFADS